MTLTLKSDILKEKQRQRTALLLAVLLSSLLIIGLYFWRVYLGEMVTAIDYGMEVSFGTDAYGSDAKTIPIETIETIDKTTTEETENQPEEDVDNIKTTDNSDVNVNTPKEKEKTTTPKKQNNPNPTQIKKTPKTDNQTGKPNNTGKGNDDNKTGDKGKTTGVDEKGLYQGTGGSGGVGLSVAGWRWVQDPTFEVKGNVVGKITFAVTISEDGEFIRIVPMMQLTTIADKKIINDVQSQVFEAQSLLVKDGSNALPMSNGKITIILKVK
jgi:hypothetical protein